MPLLRIHLPGQIEATHELTGSLITIGRLPDNTIQINDASVSAYHAELIADDGHYRLHDLASTNLSFVNDLPAEDCDLSDACTVAFGTVKCDFDPFDSGSEAMVANPQMEKHLARLHAENAKLRVNLLELQQRVDVLSVARLFTETTNSAPSAVTGERDDLRRQNAALRQELQTLREQIIATTPKQDDAPTVPPERSDAASHSSRADEPTTIAPPEPGSLRMIAEALKPLRSALDRLTKNASGTAALAELAAYANRLRETTRTLGAHPINRLGQAIDGLVQNLAEQPHSPGSAQVWSLAQAADLTAYLLDPAHLGRLKSLAPPRLLAVDDDRDLLDVIAASLDLAHLPTTPCADSRAALALVEKGEFDLLVLDVHMPDLDGPTLCSQIREIPRYWKTPILFLTVANSLDHRAQASLCGGNDFLPKPFNAAELVIKAETWLWRNRLGPLQAAG